ncbi:NUDIX hydrolase [Methylocystis hirsuta]|uniref:NUDIX domain-containing protein n=1 Tax=Methylocystis hirsuta TaxID=369798 RepID=A0A3M9XMC0_9HYPH|nr:NUDIX domain-containing protein [Methylocystis hirsuta]RNJ49413.1 NUDIX domain-containing protein [Methylocystis hirsuta]
MSFYKPYVCGFLFNDSGSHVVMIRKNRPEWQAGKINGIGGKVEGGELLAEAMVREGLEEAGVEPGWQPFVKLRYPNADVAFFAARDSEMFERASTKESEEIIKPEVAYLDKKQFASPNIAFLIPMAWHALAHERILVPAELSMRDTVESRLAA